MENSRLSLKPERDSDESDGPSPKKLKTDETNEVSEEMHIVKLLDAAAGTIRSSLDIDEQSYADGISAVKKNFSEGGFKSGMWNIDFSRNENLYACFYRYFATSVGLTRNKILKAINNCPVLMNVLRKGEEINIVSIGGGPGSDFLGFCSAFYETIGNEKLNLTIADENKRFASIFNVVEFFVREGNFGNMSKIYQKSNICTKFVHLDMASDITNQMFLRDMEEADIILMKGVLSVLHQDEKVPKVQKFIQDKMKDGAILLHIDSPHYDFEDLEEIYRTSSHDEKYTFPVIPMKDISLTSKGQLTVFVKSVEC